MQIHTVGRHMYHPQRANLCPKNVCFSGLKSPEKSVFEKIHEILQQTRKDIQQANTLEQIRKTNDRCAERCQKALDDHTDQFSEYTSTQCDTFHHALFGAISVCQTLANLAKAETLETQKNNMSRLLASSQKICEAHQTLASRQGGTSPLDVWHMAQSVCQNELDQKGLTLQVRGEQTLSRETEKLNYLSPPELYSIFENLLSNAVKYTPRQGRINVDFITLNNTLQFILDDTGIGIPESDQQLILLQGKRGSNVGQIPGTGFGLSHVYKLMKHCNGSFKIKSPLDKPNTKGTRITCEFPLKPN